MSYILDALRRADAERERERERGAVPGLNSQSNPAHAMTPPAPGRRGWRWATAGVTAAAMLLVALWALNRPPAAPAAVTISPLASPATAPPFASAARVDLPRQPAPLPAPPVLSKVAVEAIVPVAPPRPPPPTPAKPVPWSQVPEETRRQFPPLVFGGAIWSENAASRVLIVSGQLLHEGDNAAPGVVLEKIGPKSAVMRWREQRYEFQF